MGAMKVENFLNQSNLVHMFCYQIKSQAGVKTSKYELKIFFFR